MYDDILPSFPESAKYKIRTSNIMPIAIIQGIRVSQNWPLFWNIFVRKKRCY
jgi:hypothetical protein